MAEDKTVVKKKKLPLIKTREQLKMVLDGLSEQGFTGYIGEWDSHNKKVEDIMNKNNSLNIDEREYKSKLTELVRDMTNYSEIEKTIKKYFKKFKPDDKIKELINKYYLYADESIRPPSGRASKNDIINWVKFRKKYNIKNEPNIDWQMDVYNLDKKFLKINFNGDYWVHERDFTELYRLIYGEEPNEWYARKGDWQDLGKIEIKIFQNGSANIKGDLKEIKKYFYDKLMYNCIIYYNKNKELREKRADR